MDYNSLPKVAVQYRPKDIGMLQTESLLHSEPVVVTKDLRNSEHRLLQLIFYRYPSDRIS